ncbi:MAG: hypothetical protein COZ34_02260 [Candidatus Pacebacteria bacterium CG_4_10_14_3_um_filter_34_15]|nr:hypothetical protein [Candidatus Pacearchaeota archaeon]NCQ66007.1 hypothetical protein [Candidatus Paceibacterota bacterium]OIO43744.1 MAG: hypothetical protein AUJ41_04325 [Candidatus Pacebacteria bacterium CG1_02_43_31]PIQ80595.1 MAG: hypothetical protein COV78_04675 [Candidatus Pacebacteria bacterium CG11_big_fil_rev_8_21_14_0_20_34_55]PIX81650.1 MAG: hypothetical protein COZ34_02260 [Candidatus Pacebacteria bacterium CG_4_10_14_3_um_filter_34_15]PJC43366.1 MAG: hypothetical protein CO0
MKTAQQISSKKLASVLVVSAVLFSSLAFKLPSLEIPSVLAQVPEEKFVSDEKPLEPVATEQTQVTLTAIPPRIGEDNSLKALPGEKLQIQLRVRNLSEKTVNVTTSAQDFILSDDGETPIAIDDVSSNRWSLASWLTIIPTENTIEPDQTIGLNVLIEIPKDALPGGHYAMVLHQPSQLTNNFELQGDSQSAVNQRVGTLIYVIVDGDINEEAYIRNFSFPAFTEYGPVPFSYTIENNSDIHIIPQMNVEIFNILNQKVDDIQVGSKNVFPLTSRDFDGKWERIWGFGPYTAKLTMSYGSGGSIVVASSKFWLLPIKLVIVILIGLLILTVLVLSIKKHLNYRRDMDAKRIAELENQIQNSSSKKSDQDDTLQL